MDKFIFRWLQNFNERAPSLAHYEHQLGTLRNSEGVLSDSALIRAVLSSAPPHRTVCFFGNIIKDFFRAHLFRAPVVARFQILLGFEDTYSSSEQKMGVRRMKH